MVRDTGLAVSIPAVSPANAPWHTLMVINITAARKAAILFFFFILFMASFFLLCFAVLREFLVSLVSGFFRFLAKVGDRGMKMQIVKIRFGDRK